MQTTDMENILLWGFVAGLFAFMVLHFNLKARQRTTVIRWCLSVGGIAVAYFGLYFALGEKVPPAKATIGLGFIGLPALLVGILLLAENGLRWLKSSHQSRGKNA